MHEMVASKNAMLLKFSKQKSTEEFANFSSQILHKQILKLVESVCSAEKKLSSALADKTVLLD